jgi:hypothetical protein
MLSYHGRLFILQLKIIQGFDDIYGSHDHFALFAVFFALALPFFARISRILPRWRLIYGVAWMSCVLSPLIFVGCCAGT